MYLYSLKIKGFRKICDTEVLFSPNATFLIGANNAGKSSVLAALQLFLSSKDKTSVEDFYKASDNKDPVDIIEIIGEFRGVNKDIINDKEWRGFNARRVFPIYNEHGEIVDYKFKYKREFYLDGSKARSYMEGKHANPKEQFIVGNRTTWNDLMGAGLPRNKIPVADDDLDAKVPKDILLQMEDVEEFWDVIEDDIEWQANPGGISNNILSRLPQLLLIPPYDNIEEYGEKKGTLATVLQEIFHETTQNSQSYAAAKTALLELEREMSPDNPESLIQHMVSDLNVIVSSIFPGASVTASASLSCDDVLNPQYKVEFGSNVKTKVGYQGTGQIRSAVLALLQYKEERDRRNGNNNKDLIIGFEEPELYLHPHMAYLMKEVIYKLSESCQMVCSTHSPYMIDLSKDREQILNRLSVIRDEYDIEQTKIEAFNLSPTYETLQDDEKSYLKMLLKIDSEIAKVFFGQKILIVEGDTEEIVLKKVLSLLEEDKRNKIVASWTIVKARGKPVIISLVKYLRAMGFSEITVMHDSDNSNDRAMVFNQPIKDIVGNDERVVVLNGCIEEELGYQAPAIDKPFKAFCKANEWHEYTDVPESFRLKLEQIFGLEHL